MMIIEQLEKIIFIIKIYPPRKKKTFVPQFYFTKRITKNVIAQNLIQPTKAQKKKNRGIQNREEDSR